MVNIGAIRTLLEAGVFHAIPTGGESISAAEISARTGVDKNIIGTLSYSLKKIKKDVPLTSKVRLMRAVTPLGPFREVAEEEYAHTPLGNVPGSPAGGRVQPHVSINYSPHVHVF